MVKFTAVCDGNWSPMIRTTCPYCGKRVIYYTQLYNDECKHCWEILPFPTTMHKNVHKRIEYHVSSETI